MANWIVPGRGEGESPGESRKDISVRTDGLSYDVGILSGRCLVHGFPLVEQGFSILGNTVKMGRLEREVS